MFVDETRLFARGGNGGAGSASIRREPFKPRGGPDGGDGGTGGDVILRVDPGVSDLGAIADRPHRTAEHGGAGGANDRHGRHGQNLVIPVPDGTVVRDDRGLVADLVGAEASAVVARGGRGGRGTASLASSRNRVPRIAERGEPGEDRALTLELRLVADVALVGAPNAGKSTLLAALTAARPKVADYPFTTLAPNLGVLGDERVVLADVPGLIEGASEGKGLGLAFLRHVARCRVLVYVVDLADRDPMSTLRMVRQEVAAYDPSLVERRTITVGTKRDLASEPVPAGIDLAVSGLTGEGISILATRLDAEVAAARASEPPRSPYVVLRPGRDPFVVRREGVGYRVSGPRVERWVAETDLEDPRQVAELQRRLARAGVERRLAEAGARRGDEVLIGTSTFAFIPEPGGDGDEG